MPKKEAHPILTFPRGEGIAAEVYGNAIREKIHRTHGDERYEVVVLPVQPDGPWYTDGHVVVINDRMPHLRPLAMVQTLIRQSELADS